MKSTGPSTFDATAITTLPVQDSNTEGRNCLGRYRKFILLILTLNIISAALFIGLTNRPVFDDPYNIVDVQRYAHTGFSIATVLSQQNPPGPSSFLWMAIGVRLLGGEVLRDARIAALVSWVILSVGVLVGARFGRFPRIWYGALLATLIFPHSVTATGTVLTEGPALVFAVLGSLAWIEFISRTRPTASCLLLGMLGGLSMGIAVTCRQYYLALLPAAGFFALLQSRRLASIEKFRWSLGVILSLILASVPVILLVMVWRGISSPGMATGTSYDMWQAGVGLNVFRPAAAAFYSCLYLVPLAFPVLWRVHHQTRRRPLLVASLGGIVVAYFGSFLLQPGPLDKLVRAASRLPHGDFVLLALIATLTIYTAIAIGRLLWNEREHVMSCPPLLFALLAIGFFIGEQLGVGGNLPLYDRYLLQFAPFFGVVAFSLSPRLTRYRLLAFAAFSVISHVMLWRYAFGT